MRVALIHNPKAGDGRPSGAELLRIFREAGLQASYQSISDDDWRNILRGGIRFDAVVVAGGDGTIRKVVHELYGKRIPVGVIPLGTANNMARALGGAGVARHIVEALRHGQRYPVNLGRVNGPFDEDLFIEGLGIGLLADTMRAIDDAKHSGVARVADEKRAALEMLLALTFDGPPVRCALTMDDQVEEGRYLLVQVMNIGRAGSNVLLAPKADPCDGWLDVVSILDAERDRMAHYVQAMLDGADARPPFTVRRARHIEITWSGSTLHIDDQLWPKTGSCPDESTIRIDVDLETIDFLAVSERIAVAVAGG